MRTIFGLREVTRWQAGTLAVAALAAFALKRHYAGAPTEALWWILAPTAHLVGLVTGTVFTAVPGEGYFSAERLFLIEKACAGVNFMIAALAMVALTLRGRVRSVRDGFVVMTAALTASYVAAVIVNTVRIVIAMWLADHPVSWASLTAADLHRLEGITVYFGGLVILHEIIQRIDREPSLWRFAWPLGCYYLVTLGVPLAHGGTQGGPTFVTHAWTVLVLPPMLLVSVFGIHQVVHSLTRTLRKV